MRQQNYDSFKSEKHLVNQWMTQAYYNVPNPIVKQECSKHFEYIMKLLFTSKLYERNIITTQKINQKLRILQHL